MKLESFDSFKRLNESSLINELNKMLDKSDSYLGRLSIKALRNEFRRAIIKVNKRSSSYSALAVSNRDPEKDFNEIQNELDNKGFTLEYIKLLFSDKVNELIGDFKSFVQNFSDDVSLEEYNGLTDIYLYKLNEILNLNYEVSLGGERWASTLNIEEHLNPLEVDYEYLIKYAYGFHKTNYGKLVLKQKSLSSEDFVEETFIQLKIYLIKELIYNKELHKLTNSKSELEQLLKEFIMEDDNQVIFYIEDFFSEIYSKYNISNELYKESKRIILDIIEEQIDNFDYGHTFNLEKQLDKIIIR